MIKFVFIPDFFLKYWQTINRDLFDRKDSFVFNGFKNPFLKFLCKIHFSRKANFLFRIPFKSLWVNAFFPNIISKDSKQVFVFREGSFGSLSRSFLKRVKKINPKAVLIYELANPVGKYVWTNLQRVRKYYDHILTFNRADNEKYGFELSVLPSCYEGITYFKSNIIENDCFFIGYDKGRLKRIVDIYDRLTSFGLKCVFYVAGVDKKSQINRSGIIYNQPLSYDNVLKNVANTRCILEVLDGDYQSVRCFEAIAFDKKLLTTSSSITKKPFYNPNQFLFFSNTEEIDLSFFNKPFSVRPFRKEFSRDYYLTILSSYVAK